jgi:putative protein-disulfide isomerase
MPFGTLQYIYDPLCGWCYASAPLVAAAAQIPGLRWELHGGGMMAGPQRHPASLALRQFIEPHAIRITSMTGQPFTPAYMKLLETPGEVFDSAPPTAAVNAAELYDGRGREMLSELQRLQFHHGKPVWHRAVIGEAAANIGLGGDGFMSRFDELSGDHLLQHIESSRKLLSFAGGQGFPTFLYEEGGRPRLLESGRYLGKPSEWKLVLERLT